jgi:serine/threonine protein kinase
VAGRGGMGVVYRATQLRLDRTVAFKSIAPELARDPEFRARFQREARLAASIEHPNVIPIYEADELDTGELYLVMRWVEGTDLRELLAREHRLPPARAVELLAPVALALQAAHARGLVHRDVKPANVLIAAGEDGRGEHVYLTDFGIARGTQDDQGLTKTGMFVGTLAYAAPERIRGERGGPAADIYALGCMLFEALAGYPPFNRDTEIATMNAHLSDPIPSLRAEVPEVPAGLDEVVEVALAKDPVDRFEAAGDMARAMDDALVGRSPERPAGRMAASARAHDPDATVADTSLDATAPETAIERPQRRRRLPIVALGGLAAVAGAVIVIVLVGGGGGTSSRSTSSSTSTATVSASGPHITVSPLAQLSQQPGPLVAFGNDVAVAEPAAGRVVILHRDGHKPTPVAVGGAPAALAADPSGRIWVALPGAVRVISPSSGKSVARVAVGPSPSAITFGGGLAWVADRSSNDVRTINSKDFHPTGAPIPTGGHASVAIAYGADGTVWVANRDSSDVTTIRNRHPAAPQVVAGTPISIASDASAGTWVGTQSATVVRLSAGGQPASSLALNAGPVQVAVAGGEVWALSRDDASLSLISTQGSVRKRQPMSPAEAPTSLSCVQGYCAVSDQQTRQVVGASY